MAGAASSLAGLVTRRPVATTMVVLALALLGALSWRQLPLQLMPTFALPQVYVMVFQPGASPDSLETDVLRPLEGELALVGGIEEISSVAQPGSATITVSFARDTDLEFASLRVQQRVAAARTRLPEQAFVTVERFDTSQFANFVMVLSFRGDADVVAMKELADDVVVPQLSGVPGVVRVETQGGAAKQVAVTVDPDRARGSGASVVQVRQALQDATRPVVAVGTVDDGPRRLPVTVDGRAKRLADIAEAPLGGKVRLAQVADLQLALAGSVERYRVNGLTSVGLYVFKDQQANLVDVARALRARIDQFNAERAQEGLEIAIDFDGAKVIEDNLATLRSHALVGAALSLLVLLVFLWDPRPVAAIALAMPLSLLLAFGLFKAAGMTLNVLSMLGLAVAVGLLVDNSIVVLEAIAARREKGDSPIEAAQRGTGSVQRAVIAGTVTLVVVFLPLYLVQSDYTPLFREIALSVSFPLAASVFVAMAVVPLLAAWLPGVSGLAGAVRLPGAHGLPRPSTARSIYSAVLRLALRHPGTTLFFAWMTLLVTIVFGVPLVVMFAEPPRPPQERIQVRLELPQGKDTDAVDEAAKQVEALVAAEVPQVDEVRTAVREGEATIDVLVKKIEERTGPVDVDAVRKRLKTLVTKIPGVEAEVDPPPTAEGGADGGGGLLSSGGTSETLRVSGPGGAELVGLAASIRSRLEQVPGIERVSWDVDGARPTLEVRADRSRLAEYGLSTGELMGVIWATRREGEPTRYPFRLDDEDVDLVLWVEGGDTRTVDDVRAFPLATPSGARVPLAAVATVTTASEPPFLRRWQRERTVTLTYGFASEARANGEATELVRASVRRLVDSLVLPQGYHVDLKQADESLSDVRKILYLALIFLFVVLAVSFESFVTPLVLVACAPLALVGVVWGLVLTGTGLAETAAMGVVVLLGVVVNHGVLFVDRSSALMARGARLPTAILRASHDRLRPILMTTATALLGMAPLAIETGGEQEIWPPFARVVIGGLVAFTILSLVAVPAAALLAGRAVEFLRRLGAPLSLAGVAAGFGLLWLAWRGLRLFESEVTVWVLALPVVAGCLSIARVLQRVVRGEQAPDLVGDLPIEVRVHNARKTYGGWSRMMSNCLRVKRWEAAARRLGLAPERLDTRADALRRLFMHGGIAAVLPWFHWHAESTWAHFLLGLPWLVLVDGVIEAALALALRRSGAWPPGGWAGRAWRAAKPVALWAYLWIRHRPETPQDIVVLFLAAFALGAWTVLHVAVEGGLLALLRRWIAPAPVHALAGVTLAFEDGLYGLLGPNGAGKSTLMKLVVNLYRPTRGMITVNGHDLTSNAASLQSRIGYLPQFFGLPPNLTARDYLHHQALLAGKLDHGDRAALVESVLAEVGLAERADEKLGGFSGGMRQRVGIARTLLNLPRIVVVDEPTVGLDPRERVRFRNLLAELAKTRVVLLSTHVVEDISSACRQVIVLDRGIELFRGTPSALAETARGRAWLLDVPERDVPELSSRLRVVSTTSLGGGVVRVRGVGAPPDGAQLVEPNLEDAYLLLLGREIRDVGHAA